jgi:hypothetical protein
MHGRCICCRRGHLRHSYQSIFYVRRLFRHSPLVELEHQQGDSHHISCFARVETRARFGTNFYCGSTWKSITEIPAEPGPANSSQKAIPLITLLLITTVKLSRIRCPWLMQRIPLSSSLLRFYFLAHTSPVTMSIPVLPLRLSSTLSSASHMPEQRLWV